MPDWRKEEDYDFVSSLSREGRAWEFLRRNPDYAKDWHRYEAFLAMRSDEHRLKNLLLSNSKQEKEGYYYLPPKVDGESEMSWSVRVVNPKRYSEKQWLCLKWGIRHDLQDPNEQQPPVFLAPKELPSALSWEDMPSFYHGDEENFSFKDGKLVIGFDLTQPFGPQLKKAKYILEDTVGRNKPKPPGKGPVNDLISTYLRILDMPEHPPIEALIKSFPTLKTVSLGKDSDPVSKKVYEWRKRANALLKGYKTFL